MVSVIIPVYNAEKYLRRCFDSVVKQTYKDLDIIVVDDGSTDGSGAICDEYASKDNRFHVIHQRNGGVSVARQTGLNAAKGEYLCFVDADDWVELNYAEYLYEEARKEDVDMVTFDCYYEWKSGKSQRFSYDLEKVPDVNTYIHKYLKMEVHCSLWNKFFKTSSAKKIQFYPSDLLFAEDILFTIRFLSQNSVKLLYVDVAFYHYSETSNSLMNNKSDRMLKERIRAVNIVDENLNNDLKPSFFGHKKIILLELLLLKKFDLLLCSFKEIHQPIIQAGFKYDFHYPIKSCLSLALRGYPRTAYFIYRTNDYLLCFKKWIDQIIKRNNLKS